MSTVIAIVGRPNVGKSTLFNVLTKSRDALVADFPGLTRDRQYGIGKVGHYGNYIVVDTGGMSGESEDLAKIMEGQTLLAIQEADVLIFLVDGREGLTAADEALAQQIRRYSKPTVLAVNKIDGVDSDQASAEFYSLGVDPLCHVSAAHGRGVTALLNRLFSLLPETPSVSNLSELRDPRIRIAFIGRPNVGKSTLINRLLGERRLVTFDKPGTTRDSIEVPFERDGVDYTLIDTAGVRRRSRVDEIVEKFSVIKTLRAIENAQVVIMVLDAKLGISDQDANLIGLVLQAGRALVIAINRWDGLSEQDKIQVRRGMDLRLSFLDFAERLMISALHGTGVGKLLPAVKRAYDSAALSISTSELTRLLEQAVSAHQPPLIRGRRIKLRYAHMGGQNPPCIVIHGNQAMRVTNMYKRYLINYFIDKLGLVGTPVRIEFKTGENPYAGRRNRLTPRQEHKRKKLMQRTKTRD